MKKILLIVVMMFFTINQTITFASSIDYKLSNSEKTQIKQIAKKYKNDAYIKNIISDYINLKVINNEKGSKIYVTLTELNKNLNEKSTLTVYIIGDKRCDNCNTNSLTSELKVLPFLTDANFEIKDFSDEGIKKLLKDNDIKKLPAVLINEKVGDNQFDMYLKETKLNMFSLELGSQFDPFAEICDNKIDDNDNKLIDCDDTNSCSNNFKCAKKVEKPVAELYIMSYCPYGLQAQKSYLEVIDKLGKVADIKVKFVQYVMHGQKEADENVVQYCIQKEQNEKYKSYLKCFLDKEGKGEICKKTSKIDDTKLKTCIVNTKKTYKVDENMADKIKQFPDFTIDKESALKAGVQGSPTFVVNGIKLDNIGRDAKSYADAICSTFIIKPSECNKVFQNISFDPMFGFTTGQGADKASPQCGN